VNTLANTINQVFPTVLITDIPGMFNSILFATNQPTNAIQVAQNLECLSKIKNTPTVIKDVLSAILTNLQPEPETGILLTDDHAPVEWLTTRMLIDFVLSGKTKDLQ
jgi:hypothetical protein